MQKLAHKDVWTCNVVEKVYIEIVHWGIDRDNTSFGSLNNGEGVWNYYITIPERVMPEQFEQSLWLDDKPVQFTPTSLIRITHSYMQQPFADCEWHGGITFYEKIGQLVGHRAVKLGCDYSHIWDADRGYKYTVDEVYKDALTTAHALIKLYGL